MQYQYSLSVTVFHIQEVNNISISYTQREKKNRRYVIISCETASRSTQGILFHLLAMENY